MISSWTGKLVVCKKKCLDKYREGYEVRLERMIVIPNPRTMRTLRHLQDNFKVMWWAREYFGTQSNVDKNGHTFID